MPLQQAYRLVHGASHLVLELSGHLHTLVSFPLGSAVGRIITKTAVYLHKAMCIHQRFYRAADSSLAWIGPERSARRPPE